MTDWHPEDVKAALRKRGVTLTDIGREAGVSKQAVSMSLQGRFSERCELFIAKALGVKPHVIWPSRYRSNGTRIRLRAISIEERAPA